ncbi:MAG: hypothetical protein HYW90_04760 [Candidatus Sungbacteria bacterium]|nr:hypothetical protein [Candidatus Sungbacteria bacterium]
MKNYKKSLWALTVLGSLLVGFGVVYAQVKQNASVTLQKQTQGLFELTIRDPDGIQSFSLQPVGKSSYGGEVRCPKTYSSKNVVFSFEDFTPPMKAYVVDCAGNQVDFEISEPDAKGLARGKIIGPAVAPAPAPTPAPAPAATPPPTAKEKSLLDISYPVKELGNCASQEACLSYCDDEAHINECLAFAKKNNLLSKDELKKADKFAELGNKGPGGCGSRKSCEAYCSNISRMDECLGWAETNGFISEKELTEAKKVQAAVKGGAKLPGGCTSKQACETYCTDPGHIDECIAFAETSGLMPPEELAEAKKVVEFIKRGETPGGCKSKDQCESYCQEENNMDECIAFAEKAGLISPEELELFKKTGGKGPGGCKGKVQCEAFCNSEVHQEECFSWAKEHGIMKEEDLTRMREGMDRFKQEFEKMPPEVAECLKGTVGEGVLNKMLNGEPVFAKDLGEKMQACFAEALQDFGGDFGGDFGDHRGGPGGGPQDGGFPGGFSGPGGCSNPEECFKFCSEHQEECEEFGLSGGGGGGGLPVDPGTSFLKCVRKGMSASYVCGINGKGAQPGQETTYFNRCHAEQQGVEVLYEGVCKGQEPICSDVADPVCGNDNNTWISACHAQEKGGGVKHEGICTGEDFGGGGGGFPGGPGGCRSQEECEAYCREHPQKCGFGGGGGGGTPLPPPDQSCAPLPSGLVSWLDDDKTSKTTGGVALVPGKVGSALKFDASGGYVKDENSEKLNFGTGPFSLEAWFNWDGGGSSKGNIIRKANYPVSGDGAGYWLAIGKDSGKLEFFVGETVGNQGKPRGSISVPISSGVWYHVAATRDGNGTLSLYIDGQLKGTAEAANANTTSGAPFTLGAWDDRFGLTELFSGLIDEASAYNRALSASEVKAIFNAGSSGKCTNLPEPQYQQQYPKAEDRGHTSIPPIPGIDISKICPLLPTVDSCPSGQRKEAVFSSSECGTYYACVPEPTSETFSAPSFGTTIDPAKICADNHGTWDGQSCVYPTSPSGFNVQSRAASSLNSFLGSFGF